MIPALKYGKDTFSGFSNKKKRRKKKRRKKERKGRKRNEEGRKNGLQIALDAVPF